MTAFSGQSLTLDPLPPRRRVAIRPTALPGQDALRDFLEARGPELAIEPCSTHDEFLRCLRSGEPIDAVVWRTGDETGDPLEDLRNVAGASLTTPVIMVVGRYDAGLVSRAMARGITGLVGRSMSPDMVLCVLRLVLAGGTYFPCEPAWLAPAVVPEITAPQGLRRGALGLTPRQFDVLGYICQGMSNKIIARALGMRETTVKAHVMQIMRRLNAENRTQVALRVSQMGFLGPATARSPGAGT
jgi:DNA-binding NarL/FixJ family response regulator